jgi:hypothetical protein
MFIRMLRPSEQAPAAVDLICINRLPDGLVTWSGSVRVGGTPVHGKGRKFATIQEAETDAIEWARRHGASRLFILVSNA